METLIKNDQAIVLYGIPLSILTVIIMNEATASDWIKYFIAILLGLFAIYFMPVRVLRNPNKFPPAINLSSNLICSMTCAYVAVTILAPNDSVKFFGISLVIVNTLFAYILFMSGSIHNRSIFYSHFIVAFFLTGLLKFLF